MKNLKKRFPVYSRLLHLYPKSYRRTYGTQILQTLADMLDGPTVSWRQRAIIKQHALVDLGINITRERHRHNQQKLLRNPRRYMAKRITLTALLFAPLLATIAYPYLYPDYPQYMGTSSPFVEFWQSGTGILLWLELLPLFGSAIAITTLAAWVSTRDQRRASRGRKKTPHFVLGLLILVALSSTIFTCFVAFMAVQSRMRFEHQKAASAQAQREHPSLACQLVPLAAAKTITGKDLAMINPGYDANTPGTVSDTSNARITICNYEFTSTPSKQLLISVFEYKNPAARDEAYKFIADDSALDSETGNTHITIQGYPGRISYSPAFIAPSNPASTLYASDHMANITVLTETSQISISTPDLGQAYLAMMTALGNLPSKDTTLKQLQKFNIGYDDRQVIFSLVMQRNPSIAANTRLDLNFTQRRGDTLYGTYRYTPGINGTFAVERVTGGWKLISFTKP